MGHCVLWTYCFSKIVINYFGAVLSMTIVFYVRVCVDPTIEVQQAAQGVDFPSEPAQAPIGGLGLLAAGGAALAYKKLRKK